MLNNGTSVRLSALVVWQACACIGITDVACVACSAISCSPGTWNLLDMQHLNYDSARGGRVAS